MNFRTDEPRRWTGYASLTLVALFIGALAQAAQVPKSVMDLVRQLRTPDLTLRREVPAVPEPSVMPRPTGSERDICGEWLSETSQRQYNFVCNGEGVFDVYEVSDGGMKKSGSGRVIGDGSIEADLVSQTKNRKGHWTLKISSDRRMMQGPWYGEDPREFGHLTLRKV